MTTCPHCQTLFPSLYGKEYCSLTCRDGAKRKRRKEREFRGPQATAQAPDEREFARLTSPTEIALLRVIQERTSQQQEEKAIVVTAGDPVLLEKFGFIQELGGTNWILL